MTFLRSLLTNRTAWTVLAVTLAAAFVGAQQLRIGNLKQKVAQRDTTIMAARHEAEAARNLIAQYRASASDMAGAIARQNAAVEQLEVAAAERKAAARAALREAAASKAEAAAHADKINNMKVSNDECTALRQLVDSAVAGGLR